MSNKRRDKIVSIVDEKGYVSIEELSKQTGASLATLRTDLEALNGDGRLIRLRGAAISIRIHAEDIQGENQALKTEDFMIPEKQLIAVCCRKLLVPMDTVFLDTSNTNYILARELAAATDLPLSVLTNSLDIFQQLRFSPHINVILCGGDYEMPTHSLVGDHALKFIDGFYASHAFITARGFHPEKGVSAYYSRNTAVRRAMMANASRTWIVSDHSKFDIAGTEYLCAWDDVRALITDKEPPGMYMDVVKRHGINLIMPS
jgi:DeoR/GlpR family transcriptional regulator of sugar metabolism